MLGVSSWLLLAWLDMGLMKGLGLCPPAGAWLRSGSRWRGSHSPCTEHRVVSSVPAGLSFPEELKLLMFLELGLEAVLGVIPCWHGIECARIWDNLAVESQGNVSFPYPFVTRFSLRFKHLNGLSDEISKVWGQHQNCDPR